MILSMTGFGRGTAVLNGREITVELRSVNSRYFEYSSRIPRSCSYMDSRLKKQLNERVTRGKVELSMTIQNVEAADAEVTVNMELARSYQKALRNLSEKLCIKNDVTVSTLTRFPDVLATCTTYVSGAWGRIQNVRKAAQNISGTVLNCGDQFSYNDAIGPTTADYGFYAAPGYVGGKTVDVYGGGVCQVSSTLYYATLKADLEIVMRYCHQYAPGYIKWGCDATVYDGFPDFIFANNTDYPIKIVTYWNDNNVTVEILGTKVDDSYVEMVSETVDVIPWETVYEETDELAPGEKQEIQTPYTGYVVQTWRNVYAGDGSLLSSTFEATSNYESRDQIIRIGKAKP